MKNPEIDFLSNHRDIDKLQNYLRLSASICVQLLGDTKKHDPSYYRHRLR
jgi:hypothetical protein